MRPNGDEAEQLQAVGEAAEALWDATRRFQDLLDELEEQRLSRWAAYSAFRDVGAVFRFALERLRMEVATPRLEELMAVYRAGARAGLEAAADLAEATNDGGIESIDLGIQRLTIASQQFVRGRYLLQRLLAGEDMDSPEGGATQPSV